MVSKSNASPGATSGREDPRLTARSSISDDSLIAFRDSLRIHRKAGSPSWSLRFNEIEKFRALPAIGSQLLQARVEGVWVDLLRFSNRERIALERTLEELEALRRGEADGTDAGSRDSQAQIKTQDPQRCPKCDLMLEFAGEPCPRCLDHKAAITRVLQFLRPHRKSAITLAVLVMLGICLDMIWPLLTRHLVDHVLTPNIAGAQSPHRTLAGGALQGLTPKTLLLLIVGSLALIHVARAAVQLFTTRIGSRVGNAMTFDVRGALVKKLESLGVSYYSKQETGSLVGRIAYDTDAIQGFVGQMTNGFLMQFLLVVISFCMMLALEPRLALWAILPAPLVLGGAVAYWRYVHPQFERYWDRASKQAGLLNGLLSGIRVVKAFAQEESEYRRFQSASLDVKNSRESLDRTGAVFYPTMGLVFQVGGWIIWYVGGTEVLGAKLSLGALMAFFGYLGMFYGPLGNLTNLTTWLTQFSTQMHRLSELLDIPTVLPESRTPIEPQVRQGSVEFRNVNFGYVRSTPVIQNLSLLIRPGERIGIVGRSGSGKSSLVQLLARFYDVDSGAVLIDGVDVRDLSKESLRGRISMVLQEPFLFKGSMMDNVQYGKPRSSLEEVVEASRSACAHDFVLNHPLAYDASVGERGMELSGGERQRISIARALLCDSPILILDEATSALDSESELAIQLALQARAHRRQTTLIIAHRLSTLQDCDRIIVLEQGSLVESGTHSELIELDGRYASWVRIQQGRARLSGDAANTALTTETQRPPKLRWLSPETDRFDLGPRGELQLHAQGEPSERGVFALRCFPVSQPDRLISIRATDSENRVKELGLIRDLAEWPLEVRRWIEGALNQRCYFHRIERIESMKRISQFIAVKAKTDLGKLEFMIRRTPEAAQSFGPEGRLLIDLEENLYLIPNFKRLPRGDRELYHRHIFQ